MGQIIGLITARKNSVRIKRKNIRLLGGVPLIVHTFEAAMKSENLDRVIVSTDDNIVKDLAEKCGVEVPFFPRPRKLSEDCPTEAVNLHALAFLKRRGAKVDALCLLQPTTPLRTNWEIDRCIQEFQERKVDTVFTVAPVTQRPEWMFREWPDHLEPYLGVAPSMENCVSQNLEGLVYPTGGVYVISRDTVMDMKIFGERCLGVKVPWQSAIDIEEEQDLIYAEKVWEAMQSA